MSSPADRSGLTSAASATRGERALLPWIVAGLLITGLAVAAILLSQRKPGVPAGGQARDDYADRLTLSDLQMSESTSLSGGKSTFIDGQVRNSGSETVSGATLQVSFANDEALPPQTVTLPLALIRTHDPYVDTEPLSAAPLAPGSSHEFRLIFEGVAANWNQQLPSIRIVHVLTVQSLPPGR